MATCQILTAPHDPETESSALLHAVRNFSGGMAFALVERVDTEKGATCQFSLKAFQ